MAEVLRVAAGANLYSFPEDIPFLTTIALRACAPADPAVAAGREHLRSAIEAFEGLWPRCWPPTAVGSPRPTPSAT